jgi:FAD synthase
MLILKSFDESAAGGAPMPSVCCVGTFDGVHLGHQQLIRATVSEARVLGQRAVLITFFPHPRAVLGRAPEKYLTLPDEKAELVATLGVDVMLVHAFTQDTIQTTADTFVDWMRAGFALTGLWLGPDFALGYKRQGNAAYLAARGNALGFAVNVMPQLSVGDRPVSSSRIRDALQRGDIAETNLCLGRAYRVTADSPDGLSVCADATRWLPAPGRYRVLANGAPNWALVLTAGTCDIALEQAAAGWSAAARRVSIDFV